MNAQSGCRLKPFLFPGLLAWLGMAWHANGVWEFILLVYVALLNTSYNLVGF